MPNNKLPDNQELVKHLAIICKAKDLTRKNIGKMFLMATKPDFIRDSNDYSRN